MNTRKKRLLESEQSFEDLLGRAAPRSVPPANEVEQARAAIRADWQKATRGRRQRRQRTFAVAASVVVAIAVLVGLTRSQLQEPVNVATIGASNGTIYRLGEQSELEALESPDIIFEGQTIETASGASLGIVLNGGGSLRVDEKTRIQFAADNRIHLARGRVYFDSTDVAAAPLLIDTSYGSISHIGTQYMVSVDGQVLAVSVREGRVAVEGRFHDRVADAGERLTFVDSRAPRVDAVLGYGEEWRWIEATSPPVDFDGRKVIELIDWFSRETGLSIRYADPTVKQTVLDEVLRGDFDAMPRAALRQALLANVLTHREEDGIVVISEAETAND